MTEKYDPEYCKTLKDLPTLCVAQDADLKLDNGRMRVWLSRVLKDHYQIEYLSENGAWELLD